MIRSKAKFFLSIVLNKLIIRQETGHIIKIYHRGKTCHLPESLIVMMFLLFSLFTQAESYILYKSPAFMRKKRFTEK